MSVTALPLSEDQIDAQNALHLDALHDEYDSLGRQLARQSVAIDTVKARVAGFSVAVPSWGAGRGGTRFAKFPLPGEPTTIHDKLEDCAVVNQLARATPRLSPHLPWDKVSEYAALPAKATVRGLGLRAL